MDSSTRTRVGHALAALTPLLAAYVARRVSEVPRARRLERVDMQGALKVMVEQWDRTFAPALPVAVRHYVQELREVRDRWAHQEPFSERQTQRAIDAMANVAEAIGAPKSLLETLHGLSAPEAPPEPPPKSARRSTRPVAPKPAPVKPDSAAVRRDVNGVIVNAAELTADDVAMEPVRCPACERKVFKSWPLGWDAHAAHPCPGVAMGNDAERKAEYRRRYGYLFRDGG